MIHPVFRLAASQPLLLAEHAAAYASLLGEELVIGSARLKRRLAFQLAGAACLVVATILLGVALLKRHARGVTLTPAGQRLFDRASAILRQLDHLPDEVAGPAGLYLEAGDDQGWCAAIIRLIEDQAEWQRCRNMGLQQAQQFSWKRCATLTTAAYRQALEH